MNKIWNKDKHWFQFKFSLIFLILGFLSTLLLVLELSVWDKNVLVSVVLIILSLIFYSIFFAPLIKELY